MNDAFPAPEGPETEWKETLPAPWRTARTLSAFANGTGGLLWIGVRDNGERIGVADTDTEQKVLQRALELVEPVPRLVLETVHLDGTTLLRIRVFPLHGAVATVRRPGHPATAYIREGSSNQPVSRTVQRALQSPRRVRIGDRERRVLQLLDGRPPQSLRDLAQAMRMGERRTRQLVVPLMQAGLIHQREGRRLALTALGAARLR
ncbi:MAG: ATP-binding protein [Planctomycetota bacterium]